MAKEYVPFNAYGLMRRLAGQGPQRVRRGHISLDDSADYLVSRGLAKPNLFGTRIEETPIATQVGLIEWDPSATPNSAAG